MKGIDNIVKAILEDAKTDVNATKEQTQKQIKQMQDKSKAEIDKQIESLNKETKAKSEELKRREKTILDVEIRRNNLMVKREMVDEAFNLAYESLCGLKDSDYNQIVINMMLDAVESGNEQVVAGSDKKVSSKIVEQVNEKLKEQKRNGSLSLSKEVGDFTGGFVLREKGIETNCTFEMLINQLKPKIEGDVAGILFG